MARLTRAELQELNRAKVLTAARQEFSEYGFREAKIDNIAERAELTRGAVYSNFPGKRALYFAVLAELAERAAASAGQQPVEPGRSAKEALHAFARAWVARLPLAEGPGPLSRDLLPEILADDVTRRPYAQLLNLDAILLALALERLTPAAGRRVRVAESVLTLLQGASQLAAAAPGFVEPFDIVRACEHLADLDLDDGWPPPHVDFVPAAVAVDEPWSPPPAMDSVRDEPALLTGDGVVAVLGLHRLSAVEEAVRGAPEGASITAVLVTDEPAELGPLARLTVSELTSCLREAFPMAAWPRLQVVLDDRLAAAAGVAEFGDATEVAVRVVSGRVVARAQGYGACHAAATATTPATR